MESQQPKNDTSFINPEDKFWSLYLTQAHAQDKERMERWKGDSDGILIFTGLFAATVATFVVAQYPSLSSDSGDETVVLLTHIAALLANGSGISTAATATLLSSMAETPFEPTLANVFVNALWFLSLIISITCALLATLVQNWARQYSQDTQRRGSLTSQGFTHVALSSGLDRFKMDDATTVIVALVHLAVWLFFAGLLVFLYSLHGVIARCITACISLIVFSYVLFSILPVVFPTCPYRTPLTFLMKLLVILFELMYHTFRVIQVTSMRWMRVMKARLRTRQIDTKNRTLPLVYPVEYSSRRRFQRTSRDRLSASNNSGLEARLHGIRKAVECVWQEVHDARETIEFCEAMSPLIAHQRQFLRYFETPSTSLSHLLLVERNIIARVSFITTGLRSGSYPFGEAGCNRMLESCVSFVVRLTQQNTYYDPSVGEKYATLGKEMVLHVNSDARRSGHLSTYFLTRCLLYELMLVMPRLSTTCSSPSSNHDHQDRTECTRCHSVDLRHIRQTYGTGIQVCNFMDAKDITVPHELSFESYADCAFCRFTLLIMDLASVHMKDTSHVLTNYKHIWLPILQELSIQAGIPNSEGMSYKDPSSGVADDHPAFYLLAQLLDRVDFRGKQDDAINMFPRGDDGMWQVCPSFTEFLRDHAELPPLFETLVHCFRKSPVSQMKLDDVRIELGYSALPTPWKVCVEDGGRMVFGNTDAGISTYHDPRILPIPSARDDILSEDSMTHAANLNAPFGDSDTPRRKARSTSFSPRHPMSDINTQQGEHISVSFETPGEIGQTEGGESMRIIMRTKMETSAVTSEANQIVQTLVEGSGLMKSGGEVSGLPAASDEPVCGNIEPITDDFGGTSGIRP